MPKRIRFWNCNQIGYFSSNFTTWLISFDAILFAGDLAMEERRVNPAQDESSFLQWKPPPSREVERREVERLHEHLNRAIGLFPGCHYSQQELSAAKQKCHQILDGMHWFKQLKWGHTIPVSRSFFDVTWFLRSYRNSAGSSVDIGKENIEAGVWKFWDIAHLVSESQIGRLRNMVDNARVLVYTIRS